MGRYSPRWHDQGMRICELCHHPHQGLYGTGRFCSKFCAHRYTTRGTHIWPRCPCGKVAKKFCVYCSPECLAKYKRTNKGLKHDAESIALMSERRKAVGGHPQPQATRDKIRAKVQAYWHSPRAQHRRKKLKSLAASV